MTKWRATFLGTALGLLVLAAAPRVARSGEKPMNTNEAGKITRTDAEWRKLLSPEQYRVLRQKGTERPFCGAFWDQHEKGVYKCAGCGQPLFASGEKFDSGTGWPSYVTPLPGSVTTVADRSHGMVRTEVICSRCDSHLGHVFEDGPPPTGLRYCINSVSMVFEKAP